MVEENNMHIMILREKGLDYLKDENYKQAVECLAEAIGIEKSARNDPETLAGLIGHMGGCYMMLKE
jgi:Tfp pilus assembly protein PilF